MHRRSGMCVIALLGMGAAIGGAPAGTAVLAQEKPPAPAAPGTVEAEFAAARKLMAESRWSDAQAAWTKLLTSRPNDPAVAMQLPEIEDALRTSAFRSQWAGVDMKAELGPATVKFNPGTRIAEFDTAPGRDAEGWSVTGSVAVFDRPFENEVAIEFAWTFLRGMEIHPPPAMLVAYDTENQGGYVLRISASGVENVPHGQFGGGVARLNGDERTEIGKGDGASILWSKANGSLVRYERGASSLFVKMAGKELVRANDTKFRSGSVAIVTGTGELPRSIRVVGKLSDKYVRRIAAEAENRALRAWEAKFWNRDAVIPAWIVDAERKSRWALESLPAPQDSAKATVGTRAACGEMLRKFYEGDDEAFNPAAATWPGLDARAQRYVVAVGHIRNEDWRRAADAFARLAEQVPDFAPALTGLAWARFEQGQRDAARKILAESIALDPAFPVSHELAARIALADGDVAAARQALTFAASKGVLSPGTHGLAGALLRLERGPPWMKRFEHQTAHFDIASDHSVVTCMEVGKQLEDAYAAYQAKFRALPATGRRAKVYVFSGNEGYLDYAADVGTDLRNTLGVYMPLTRHLAVFLHDDRVELWNTVRHEGFHQYLHELADDVPLWFNEGYAEFFGFSRRKLGKTVTGQADDFQRAAVGIFADKFTPLADLFVMDRRPFMAKAGVHYVQSWSVIHFLRETKHPLLKGILDRYLDALIAGKGRTDAYDEILKPVMPTLEASWKYHLTTLAK